MVREFNRVAMDGTVDSIIALDMRIEEKGRQANPIEVRINRRDSVRENIPCRNPLCNGGGLALGNLLRELVRDRQAEYVGANFCTGQEGDLEKPETLKSCTTRFEVQAELRFR
jgi:hypothetical protein